MLKFFVTFLALIADSKQLHMNMSTPMPSYIARSEQGARERSRITVLTTVCQHSDTYTMGPWNTQAMQVGIDKLGLLPNLLPNYDIAFELMDDKCENAKSITALMERLEQNDKPVDRFPIALLSECTDVGQYVTASLVEHYNYVGIVTSNNIEQLSVERPKLPNYYGQFVSPDIYYVALIEFLKHFGWNKVAIISELEEYSNMMDGYLVTLLDAANITVLYMAKLTMESKDEAEMSSNFEMLKSRDAHIIISQALSSLNMACWLHRYGIFGPNHVIFEFAWNAFSDIAEIPAYLSWCSAQMILEVQRSKFIYADTTLEMALGPDTHDFLGTCAQQLSRDLVAEIEGSDPFRETLDYYAPYYYDRTIYTVLILNATETLLNQRNQTLLDWTTSSPKFRENGQEIVSVLKEAIRSVKMTGLKGEYQFADNETSNRPTGFLPITFSQVSVNANRTISERVVSYYKSSTNEIIFVDGVQWRTRTSQPPKDAVHYVSQQLPVFISKAAQYLYQVAVAACGTVFLSALSLFAYSQWKSKRRPDSILVPLSIGNLAMLSHIFLIPYVDSIVIVGDMLCASAAGIVVLGYTLTVATVSERLRSISRKMGDKLEMMPRISVTVITPRTTYVSVATPRNSLVAITTRLKQIQLRLLTRHYLIGTLGWFLAVLILGLIALLSSPVPVIKKQAYHMPPINSEIDKGIAYTPFYYGCSPSSDLFSNGVDASSILVSLIAMVEAYLLGQAILAAYRIYSMRQQFRIHGLLTQLINCFYCKTLTTLGGCFVCALTAKNGQALLLVISTVIICLAVLDTLLVILPHLKTSWSRPVNMFPPELFEAYRISIAMRRQSLAVRRTSLAVGHA